MQKTFKRILAVGLASVMAVSAFSITASAYNANYQSETHTVFKHTEQTLAPGVEYYKNYAYAKDGEQNVYFVTTADVSRNDVVVQTSYMDQYKNKTLGMSKLSNQVAYANSYYSDPNSQQFISEYYNVVAGCNASFYNMTTGQPTGVCYIDGVDFGTNAYPAFFAMLKDGTAVIDDRANKGNYTGDRAIWQAVGGSQWLVRNGADVTASAQGDYNTDRHCRTAVGVTAEGKVVIMSLDGRQSPYSIGGSMHEIAQIMIEAECVAAINLDGGGSTTYVAKEEGEDEAKIVNVPSDGSERAISAGIIIASTAAPSNVFDHATLTAEEEYISAKTTTKINAKGISPAGTSADIPAEATFTTNNGNISADGVLAPAHTGDATVQMVYNGKVVGETVVHVVVPDSIEFSVATLAAPYGKDADITMIAKYGEFNFNVKCDVSDYQFVLSDNKFGSVEGFVFHATNDTTVTGTGTITATFAGSDRTAQVPLTVGKGSETLFDFESDVDNHQTSRWSGYDGYNAGIVTTCTPVTAENGKVHSGEYAMAYDMDFSQLTYYEDYTYSLMCYNWEDIKTHGFTYDADGVKQRGAEEDFVDITGATGLGMWMYIPDEVDVRGLDVRYTIGGKQSPTSAYTRINSAMGTFFPYRDGLGTDGWYYYYFDLSNYSSWACLRLQNTRTSNSISKNGKTSELYGDVMQLYVNDRAWKDDDKQFKSYTSHVTLYIDDITVDYSSVVPDREAPVFSNLTYAFAGASDAMALNDNATINYTGLEFNAAVADNTTKTNATGLNANSVKGYIDGVEVDSTFKNGKVSIPTQNLADGAHTVTFEAADNTGNTSHITKKFTVNAGTNYDTIKVVARNANLTSTYVGSLYYIDIVATAAEKVDKVTTTLKVNNVNDWEPQGIEAANGFTASYKVSNFDKGLIDVTVESTGNVNATGEQVIASIPVRTWYPHNALGKDSNWIITSKKCVYPMDTQVFTKAGSVSFTDGTSATFSSPDIQCDSEAMCEYGYIGVNKGNEGGTNVVTSWHEHNAQPMEDKPATCTEAGYSGRTFCQECNSVIDWGTEMPATGHTYDFVDGVLKCVDCDELYNGEYTDGKLYVDGVAAAGWIGDKYYVDGKYVTGIVEINGEYYEFDNEGVSQGKYTGLVVKDGVNYYSKLGVLSSGWYDIDGDWYLFDEDTLAGVNGTWKNSNKVAFEFENGKLQSGKWEKTIGKYRYWYGPTYYHLTSRNVNYLEQEVDGNLYLFDQGGYRATGIVANHESNSKTLNWFDCGEDGKAAKLAGPQILNYNDKLYYVDANGDSPAGYGLVKVDDDYYFVIYDGSVKRNGDRVVPADLTNGLLPAGTYNFDENGKMTNVPVINGVGDDFYYRENGVIVKDKGLVKVGDDYYYVVYNGKVKRNDDRVVPADKTNDLLPAGTYHFGEDGKMTTLLNGIDPYDFYYRENGVIIKSKGLIEIDGDYYFVLYNGQIKRNGERLVPASMTNNLLPEGTYNFDADGKITNVPVLNGVGDDFFYRENGVIVKDKGLVKVGDDYYYVVYNGKVKRNDDRVVPADKTNDLLPAGTYHFGEDGKMTTVLNGVDPSDFYYREDGTIIKNKGVVMIGGDFYYVTSNGQVKRNGDRVVPASMTNNLIPEGTYNFGADGKITNPPQIAIS